jgi:hypothetical protein
MKESPRCRRCNDGQWKLILKKGVTIRGKVDDEALFFRIFCSSFPVTHHGMPFSLPHSTGDNGYTLLMMALLGFISNDCYY